MKKIIDINGMSCGHCQAKVEKALSALGVTAKVDLKKKTATISGGENISNTQLNTAITEAGFEVVEIREKKGLFGG